MRHWQKMGYSQKGGYEKEGLRSKHDIYDTIATKRDMKKKM